MEEWKEYILKDVCTELSDGLHKAPKFKIGAEYIFVNAKNIVNGFIVDNDPTKKSTHEEYLKYASPLNDTTVLYSIDGTIGNIALYRGEKCILGKGACYMNPNPTVLDRMFLYYELQSPRFKSYIDRMSTGSTIKHISLKTMRGYTFTCPPIGIQKQISSILKSLDDKIEVNRRINENLEQLAQALFKSWFVDFEPFKDGEFVESELGMTPKGWRVGTLKELIEIKYGKDHKKLADGNIPVYGSGGIMRKVEKSLYSGESVLIPRKGSLNNVLYVNEDFWTVDTMFYSIPRIKDVAIFTYLFLSRKDLESLNAGSAVPSMTTEILNNMHVIIPQLEVLEKFNHVCFSIYSIIKHNEVESRCLAELRDTLLPRLMSGKLKVNEIENSL